MNTRRTYLDTLNAGRQRKSEASLEQLSRSLEHLEQQLDRRGNVRPPAAPAPTPQFRAAAPERAPERAAPREPAYGRTDPYAPADAISAELRTLREEMRQQMNSGLRQEFQALRQELEQSQTALQGRGAKQFSLDLERLADSMHSSLAERNDDRALNVLRLELEQVKGAISALAREDTVRSVGARWDDVDRKLAALQTNFGGMGQTDIDPALAALNERLDQIGMSVSQLPESLSIDRLEEKIRNLASAIDHFSRKQDADGPNSLSLIEGRLEEISRAIVATSMAPQAPAFDPKPFERIESRLSALANQFGEADRPNDEMIERLNFLSNRIEDIAASASLPDKAIETLSRQIAILADKVSDSVATPGFDASLLQDIDRRLADVTIRLDQAPSSLASLPDQAIETLSHQIALLADKVSDSAATPSIDSTLLQDIDRRLTDVTLRLDQGPSSAASDEAIFAMQKRLEYLAKKMETGSRGNDVDPGLIQSLESQLGALSGFLAKSPMTSPEVSEIAPRLDRLEATLADSRSDIVRAAREAAEQAVKTFSGSGSDTVAVSGLTQDLKALEDLTRRSDDRNSKTFEAIHDTLIKIVDRLSSIDTAPPAPVEAPKVFGRAETPPLDVEDYDEPLLKVAPRPASAGQLSPAQAAAAAAAAALSEIEAATSEGQRFQPATAAARAPATAKAAGPMNLPGSQPAPEVALDSPLDPAAVNRPLEPGSRAPDLNAIMNRVREDRDVAGRGDAEAARSDFIAAARRAAQAAAAEAEVLKRKSEPGNSGGGKSKLLDMLTARKKPIMMGVAAIVVALLGLQLGGSLLSDPNNITNNQAQIEEPAPTPTAPVAAEAQPEPTAETPAEPVRVVGQQVEGDGGSEPEDLSAMPTQANAASAPAEEIVEPTTDEAATVAAVPSAEIEEPAPAAPAPAEPAPAAAKIEVPADAGPVGLREAAASGDAKALFEVGARYGEGRGVKADMASAAKWYEQSADLGFAPAQYRIGNLYEKGMGVERDVKKAKTWYQMSADQGNASAMHNLAVLFATDAGQGADNESAAKWFQKAAELGVKDSQFNLGILSAKGVGMPQNLEDSYKWFALVAKGGDRDAAQKRDEIAKSLRPEQLKEARAKVELWKPEPLAAGANSVDVPEGWRESPAKTAGIDMKKAIRNVQALLNKAGYDAGTADGMMGDKTKNAISAFQKDNGMESTGAIDEKMVKALLAKK